MHNTCSTRSIQDTRECKGQVRSGKRKYLMDKKLFVPSVTESVTYNVRASRLCKHQGFRNMLKRMGLYEHMRYGMTGSGKTYTMLGPEMMALAQEACGALKLKVGCATRELYCESSRRQCFHAA
eukprot:1461844-Amphidinium_carterae.1